MRVYMTTHMCRAYVHAHVYPHIYAQVCALLIRHKADVNVAAKDGRMALHGAAWKANRLDMCVEHVCRPYV